eukprot:1663621-Amphidinium_carterae.1
MAMRCSMLYALQKLSAPVVQFFMVLFSLRYMVTAFPVLARVRRAARAIRAFLSATALACSVFLLVVICLACFEKGRRDVACQMCSQMVMCNAQQLRVVSSVVKRVLRQGAQYGLGALFVGAALLLLGRSCRVPRVFSSLLSFGAGAGLSAGPSDWGEFHFHHHTQPQNFALDRTCLQFFLRRQKKLDRIGPRRLGNGSRWGRSEWGC